MYVKEMTFDEYDQMVNKFQQIHTKTFWPTLEQIDRMEREPERFLTFCCYLYECGAKPNTNQEKYSKKNLFAFINRHLSLT